MNTSNIKKYAPKARTAFIDAITKQAAKYGVTESAVEPCEAKGDLVLIGDRPFPSAIRKPREQLVKRIEQSSFDQVIEHIAYSWFNRLCAIRYMELKGFLDHGRRVLSHPDHDSGFQILDDCLDVDIEGLDQGKVRDLKLDGTKDEELYRELLLAQCHALHKAMPFLFEAVADESELLLPENLTKTDSLIRDLVTSIPEEDWSDVEIIGWLYQFYISEKKDQVIGKVVKSEDIPAATQLFTPNWIVQYLVQNSVGRQWLQTYPDSPLKEKMPYYIEPAEQTPEVQAQLAEIIPSEITPESIKVLDPACGSGHILVEAYKVLKSIYEERGYRSRDIPQLILEHNLFGLDIDDRAGQLAGFALMMLAREDDRRIFTRDLNLHVLSIQETTGVNLPALWRSLNLSGDWESGTSQGLFEEEQQDLGSFSADSRYQLLERTLDLFKYAKTLGSLIDIPNEDYEGLQALLAILSDLKESGDAMQRSTAESLIRYVHQALLLAQRYDAVIANPPYMGLKFQNPTIKKCLKQNFSDFSKDIFSAFIVKSIDITKSSGSSAFVTPFVWMFITSYESLRRYLSCNAMMQSLIQLEYNAFAPACIPVCGFSLQKYRVDGYKGSFIRLSEFKGVENQSPRALEAINNKDCGWLYEIATSDLKNIPGEPLVYWASKEVIDAFSDKDSFTSVGDMGVLRKGMSTGDNPRFVRFWSEIDYEKAGIDPKKDKAFKWAPYNNGGEYRKWYGNIDRVVNWENDGFDIRNFVDSSGKQKSVARGVDQKYKPMISWTSLSSSNLGVRFYEGKYVSDQNGNFIVADLDKLYLLLGFLCTPVAQTIVKMLNPTMHILVSNVSDLPLVINSSLETRVIDRAKRAVQIAKEDWLNFEYSWDFSANPIITHKKSYSCSIESCYKSWVEGNKLLIDELKVLEESNNREFIDIYGMQDQLQADVDVENLTLTINPRYRYGGSDSDIELENRFRSDSFGELISYSIGCMMGRYSLDQTGLFYASSNNRGFDELIDTSGSSSFLVDDDGIIPLTNQEWFPDDATNRFREFISVVWGEDRLQTNLEFVVESLCLSAVKPKKSESSMDTIRRYLSTQFYKDHLKTYKKRPIYWLFSSGKQKAFECLVYLHRYNEGTLARMRTEYVIPLTAKMAAYVQKLENDKDASTSAAEVKRLEKEIIQLHKQQAELSEFDEKLRHYADQRISLDLDEGVKVNYGKFGDLLAEVRSVTGKKPS